MSQVLCFPSVPLLIYGSLSLMGLFHPIIILLPFPLCSGILAIFIPHSIPLKSVAEALLLAFRWLQVFRGFRGSESISLHSFCEWQSCGIFANASSL